MQKFWHYRALSLHIVPYRAVSLLAQKNCCIFAPRMRQKLQYPAVTCSKVQYRAVSCSIVPYRALSCRIVRYRTSRKINVVPLHQKNVDGGST